MKRLSNIMESFWGDVHKRSRGDEIRQEDIAATCVIDGVEYKFTNTFMGMGDTYNEENSDEWYCFAFNKMPNGSTIIDGDTDSVGCFGIDMYDMQDWDEWDVFVLKDYLEKTKEELVDESINAGHINDIGIAKIESILVNYIEEIFEKHMSDFARYYIFELQPSDWNQSLFTVWTNIDDLPDNVKEEFDGYDIVEMHQISFPSLVEWDWDDRLVKDLTDAYEKLGWKRSEEYSLSVKAPGKTRGECFVKLSEKGVKESFWGDVHKRSKGDEVRKEDAFNPEYVDFGPDTTVYWAVDNLEIDGNVKFYFDDVKDYNNNGWRLPTVDEVKQLKWIREMAYYRGCKHIKFDDGQELRLKTNGSGGFHMWTKEINPKFPTGAYAYGYDNSYDFDIDSFNKSINRLFVFLVKDKKVNESFWGDVHKRSRGDEVRKEDDIISNIKELKPIDMGVSVLWADRDLESDENVYFSFLDANKIIKNSGWRLPTFNEMSDLIRCSAIYKNTFEECKLHYYKTHSDLTFEKCGYQYADEDRVLDCDSYYAWTSDTAKSGSEAYQTIFIRKHIAAVPMHYMNRCCVRLVKDK